jgi:hypothetical protein
MSKPEIECTRVRACKWRGNWSDLVRKPNAKDTKKHGVECSDNVCPKCGCKTFYTLEA